MTRPKTSEATKSIRSNLNNGVQPRAKVYVAAASMPTRLGYLSSYHLASWPFPIVALTYLPASMPYQLAFH